MGVALYIVPERPIEGISTVVNGKALAKCRPVGAKSAGRCRHLDALARAASVRPLMEFFSMSQDEAIALLGEEVEPLAGLLPPEEWFSAAEGLAAVRGLLAYLKAHPDAAADVDRLIEDLQEFEDVLAQLDAAGVRWHLAVDF